MGEPWVFHRIFYGFSTVVLRFIGDFVSIWILVHCDMCPRYLPDFGALVHQGRGGETPMMAQAGGCTERRLHLGSSKLLTFGTGNGDRKPLFFQGKKNIAFLRAFLIEIGQCPVAQAASWLGEDATATADV